MNRLLLLFAAAACTPSCVAQLSFGGMPIALKAEKLHLAKVPVVELPAVDPAPLLAEDAARAAAGIKGPFRFGVNHGTDLGMENSGNWSILADGTRLWRLQLHCPQAYSINFVLDAFIMPAGAKLFVHNEAGQWLGAFTRESAPGRTLLGVTQLAGDRVTLSYEEPAGTAVPGRLHLSQVTHAYRDVLGGAKGLNDSGPCNNNTSCPEGDPWQQEISAVAMITVGGSGLCTGTLLNNCASDGTPYFLTANHCVQGDNPATWSFRFNWESPTCTPTTNGPVNQTVSGALLLENSPGSDVALLQLDDMPPAAYEVYYSGWDASGTMPTSQTGIHHPSGDIKKISFDYDGAVHGTMSGADCWRIMAWDDGTTEPGSSGSGLWNQDHRLIGQLYGGQASCNNNVNDYYGRFDVSFPLLTDWLGGCGDGVDGYDPNLAVYALDASVTAINGIEANYCNTGIISPAITIKNFGTTTLTQLMYSHVLDGGSPVTAIWNGSLASGATAQISLGDINVGNGGHTFSVSCSAPNGGADEHTANDAKSTSFTVANPGFPVDILITLDNYGSETTWTVTGDTGAEQSSGGPYADFSQGLVTEELCLPAGCYVFTIMDQYGDGICCSYGMGDFQVVSGNGAVLVDGDGDFEDSADAPFCIEASAIAESEAQGGMAVFPNPSTGRLDVMLAGWQAGSLRVRDMAGRVLLHERSQVNWARRTIDLALLADGCYALEVEGDGHRTVQRIVLQR
ncbi:MAG: trypsin-like peptidase domain-containing protein [Flavobacteriales bacterium]|nr:trypsin-like peptidase domain-containing protein [Flavobacteriales bacterium]MBP9079227.1 trypsin-like peptidase domain-containing protein [Flavobacteriales bacterium]